MDWDKDFKEFTDSNPTVFFSQTPPTEVLKKTCLLILTRNQKKPLVYKNIVQSMSTVHQSNLKTNHPSTIIIYSLLRV